MTTKGIFSKMLWVGIAAIIISAVLVIFQPAKANPPYFQHHVTATASTTLAYMNVESVTASEATTTLSFLTNNADSVTLHLAVVPSSTLETILRFRVEYSDDGRGYYGENYTMQYPSGFPTSGYTAYNNFLESSSTPDHLWRPNPTTTDGILDNTRRKEMIFPVYGDYMRFVFSAKDGSNNLGLWADAVTRIQNP